MTDDAVLTTGASALDDLLDGVRVGDNLVLLAQRDTDLEAVGRGFLEAVAPAARTVVAAMTDWAVEAADGRMEVLDERRGGEREVGDLVRALAQADDEAGQGAAFLIDSLTAVQERWGPDAALELFLGTCPRLYRRGSVAMWLLDADAHDRAFIDRLCDITQVVVDLRAVDDGELEAEVVTAAGRQPTVVGRRRRLRVTEAGVEPAGEISSGRERLGQLVRSQRVTRGLAQAELARRIGISPSALSQVERGVRGLSAERLIRIWEVLGVPFGPQDTLQRGYRVSRRSGHRELEVAPGVRGRELLDDPAAGRLWSLTFRAGASGRQPLFASKTTEVLLVLHGVLDLHVGGHPETLHDGDVLVASEASIDGWRNPDTASAEVLWSVG